MTDIQETPKHEDMQERLYRVAQLAATAPTLEALVLADGVFTADERRMLLAFEAEKEALGKETERVRAGELTTREKMALAWHRQQTDADQRALNRALIILDMIDTLWQAKGGAA